MGCFIGHGRVRKPFLGLLITHVVEQRGVVFKASLAESATISPFFIRSGSAFDMWRSSGSSGALIWTILGHFH